MAMYTFLLLQKNGYSLCGLYLKCNRFCVKFVIQNLITLKLFTYYLMFCVTVYQKTELTVNICYMYINSILV